jgi:pimeloyl-ACP methyl ester carboxylesterase
MKIEKIFLKFLAQIFILSALITSCSKEPAESDYNYFVSKELVSELPVDYLKALVQAVSATNPEALAIKSLIVSDVNVYEIVYNTTLDNQEIEASGLVCVPATPGDYPVLSFQNGTNTVNTDAPSNSPSAYSYQMIELIASLGYIVVISDYPGFGASASLPHPYLVKEATVRSLVDNLYAVKELTASGLPGIIMLNEYYLLGYSQGGWASLAVHRALELEYSNDFDLIGSACGAGPYNIYKLMEGMINVSVYPMPVYLGYILNAYTTYGQFTNTVNDIFNEPYASEVGSLYTGSLTSEEINNQLTTSIPDLITPAFLAGFSSAPAYSSVRDALNNNSIPAWHTYKPLLLLHGANDTHVDPASTENIYDAMIGAGTDEDICTKVIIPDADHGSGVLPAMIQGILFLNDLKTSGAK